MLDAVDYYYYLCFSPYATLPHTHTHTLTHTARDTHLLLPSSILSLTHLLTFGWLRWWWWWLIGLFGSTQSIRSQSAYHYHYYLSNAEDTHTHTNAQSKPFSLIYFIYSAIYLSVYLTIQLSTS